MRQRSYKSVIIAIIISLALFSLQLAGCATTPEKRAVEPDVRAEAVSIEDQWGVEIVAVRMAAAGHMVDFRYRVVNADKAKEIFVRKNKPYLIDQDTGKVLKVPTTAKVGPLRTSDQPQEGRAYWMFFSNGGGVVKKGSKVTVVIGGFRAADLIVE